MGSSAKPNYGIDAPGVIRVFFFICCSAGLAAWLLHRFNPFGLWLSLLAWPLLLLACCTGLLGSSMLAYAVQGKLRHRDQILGMVNWKGNERVLDIGTGRGLMLIGAAKRLRTGRAIGIDIWNAADLSQNRAENALLNIALEGMEARTELRTEDARSMNFQDCSFDIILSVLCIHNIEPASERVRVCQEVARLLKPGGTALISDYTGSAEYAAALTAAGLRVKRSKYCFLEAYSPMRVVIAVKP